MLFTVSFAVFVIGAWLTVDAINDSLTEKFGVVFALIGLFLLLTSLMFSVSGV